MSEKKYKIPLLDREQKILLGKAALFIAVFIGASFACIGIYNGISGAIDDYNHECDKNRSLLDEGVIEHMRIDKPPETVTQYYISVNGKEYKIWGDLYYSLNVNDTVSVYWRCGELQVIPGERDH